MFRVLIIALCVSMLAGCDEQMPLVKVIKTTVNAPFEMPPIESPNFEECPRFSILEYGAVAGDQKKTTLAIAAAISAGNKAGCGRVIIPKGEWLTGKIHFKSNINIHLEEGAVLLFSAKPEDYLPPVNTSWEGMECYNYSPLIYAFNCQNVAITGNGLLKAKMDTWEVWFARPKAHMNSLKRLYTLASENVPVEDRQMVNDSSNLRPHFIQFNRCRNVLLQDFSIKDSPFWVIHPYLSEHVTIRGVKVEAHGHNNDGVDPEMTRNMLIEDCVFDQGDDAIAIKSGRNQDAWRLNAPSKNIVVRNCLVKNGHQLLAVGSELSGGVENVFMDHCKVESGSKLFNLVFIKTNERRGGYVKNIHVTNIEAGNTKHGVLGIETDVLYQWRNLVPTYERRLTPISDVYLSNITAGDVEYISRVLAQEELPVKKVQLTNIIVGSVRGVSHIHENVIEYDEFDVSENKGS
ncbi:glycoside hydrolase family 28 protein [Marinoscillum sp. MHG1-6]|uniref:glycoside hydrolase family 28 protein n=1 Tax=Marinoscillum sp. MHG1-6 TaxID=2959627 RepID=UPI00215703E9|nr:glycoside hydrolase family 28 protein [Marinoscillum sp. MHG1-6]